MSTDGAQPQIMAVADWLALGERLFGADNDRWRFKCPACKLVMSMHKARALPDEERAKLRSGGWQIESECVGRYLADVNCNWCAYGLFRGPYFVALSDGHRTPVFGFDDDAALESVT